MSCTLVSVKTYHMGHIHLVKLYSKISNVKIDEARFRVMDNQELSSILSENIIRKLT